LVRRCGDRRLTGGPLHSRSGWVLSTKEPGATHWA
jgi:hypothetical protein